MAIYEQGRLIWAEIPDLRGHVKPEPRPAIVTEQVEVNDPDDLIPVVVCSTTFSEPLPDDQQFVHRDFTRDNVTKLSRPTVAVCGWTAAVRLGDVERRKSIRAKRFLPIMKKVLELQHNAEPPGADKCVNNSMRRRIFC